MEVLGAVGAAGAGMAGACVGGGITGMFGLGAIGAIDTEKNNGVKTTCIGAGALAGGVAGTKVGLAVGASFSDPTGASSTAIINGSCATSGAIIGLGVGSVAVSSTLNGKY